MPSHKFDLAHMRVLTEALGHPERAVPSVLIAGTNGKGSTAATLASILTAAGYSTGLYTSPHLVRINERIRINGEPIADEQFAATYDHVHRIADRLFSEGKLPWHPSFFETVTAIAFECFARLKVDIAVLEVGMGGRLDATNITEPLVSVIADIDLDHQKFLGDTVAAIAAEKAGIMRTGKPAITLPQHPQANEVLGTKMIETGAIAVNAARNMPPVSPGSHALFDVSEPGRTRYMLTVLGEEILIDTPLVGRHQLRNLALAITAAEELTKLGFPMTAAQIAEGISHTRWFGRFQYVPGQGNRPEIILDVAHNPAGAWALRGALSERFRDRPLCFVFGAMRDKAIAEIAGILFPTAEVVIATHTEHNPRSATPAEIHAAGERSGTEIIEVPLVKDAIVKAIEVASKHKHLAAPVIVVTGSIYIVGEAMEALGILP
ncbi:MAG TPA: folylpolyglutamate synthase/dihydrofolate synthase family protein [Terriglobales bacterium]|nr:folylpolyglutamate synthase/dihydrofolate synthase family protein [Terriglobales bacterium]